MMRIVLGVLCVVLQGVLVCGEKQKHEKEQKTQSVSKGFRISFASWLKAPEMVMEDEGKEGQKPFITHASIAFLHGTTKTLAKVQNNVTQELQGFSQFIAKSPRHIPGREIRVLSMNCNPLKSGYLKRTLSPMLDRARWEFVISGVGECHVVTHSGRVNIITFVHFGECEEGSLKGGFTVLYTGPNSYTALAEKAVVFEFTEAGLCPMVFQLYHRAAPVTTEAFAMLVEAGVYNKTTFYRAEPGFVLQGGMRTVDGGNKKQKMVTHLPIEGTLSNAKYTVSMARSQDPLSGSTEYFVNLASNKPLDRGGKGPGYTVFATIYGEASRNSVKSIAKRKTEAKGKLHILEHAVEIAGAYTMEHSKALRLADRCGRELSEN